MLAEEFAEEPEIWPENALAIEVFVVCLSQWRTSFRGDRHVPVALELSAVRSAFWFLRVPRKIRTETYRKVRVMEATALRHLRGRR